MNPGEDDDFVLDEEALAPKEETHEEDGEEESQDDEESESPAVEDDEGPVEDEQVEAAPKGRKTASDRVREKVELAKRESERAGRLEKELAELKARDAERQRREETQNQQTRAERRLLMTTEERFADELAELREQQTQFLKQQQFVAAENSDQAAFRELKASDPRVAKYEDQVERELSNLRAKGVYTFGRKEVLAALIGMQVLNGKSQVKAQVTKGKQNIRRAQTAPNKGQSDLGGRQRQGKSLEDRLQDVPL